MAEEDFDLYADLNAHSVEPQPTDATIHPEKVPASSNPMEAELGNSTPEQTDHSPLPSAAPAAITPAQGSVSLYVGNLAWWTSDAALQVECAQYGKLRALPQIADDPVC